MLAKLGSSLIYNLCPLLAGLEHCQSDFAEKKTQIVDSGGQEWRWEQAVRKISPLSYRLSVEHVLYLGTLRDL